MQSLRGPAAGFRVVVGQDDPNSVRPLGRTAEQDSGAKRFQRETTVFLDLAVSSHRGIRLKHSSRLCPARSLMSPPASCTWPFTGDVFGPAGPPQPERPSELNITTAVHFPSRCILINRMSRPRSSNDGGPALVNSP